MPHSLDQLLPSLQALGVWTYWILGLFAMLEAIVFTGIAVPGMIAVIAGGILVQRGVLDYLDLSWFIFAATVFGSEVSFRLGRLAESGLSRKPGYATSKHANRAKALLARYGGFALVVGRFFGPLSAFVPFTAAMAAMPHRRFMMWNLASAVPYAFGLPAAGYFFGSAIATLGASAPRILAFGAIVLAGVSILWFIVLRLQRSLPLVTTILQSALAGFVEAPIVRRITARHPRAAAVLSARFVPDRFWGLPATVLAALFVFILGVYVDSVFDFIGSAEVAQADRRVANLLYAMRDARLIAIFGWITAFGGWEIILPLVAGVTGALLFLRYRALAAGLWIVILGNQATVTVLKHLFDRPRSLLGYFVETSGSFPSGHAAASVAIWGMLFYLAWRVRLLSATVATLAAATVACAIGLSRIYLIEHYVSDVVNGYIVGGLWLVIGITFCQWWSSRPKAARSGSAQDAPVLASVSLGSGLVVAITLASLLTEPVNSIDRAAGMQPTDFAQLSSGAVPLRTESLAGAPRQPISLVIAAPDAATLSAAMQADGWVEARRPNLATLLQAFWADWTGGSIPQPLVIPTFWQARPNDLAFTKLTTQGANQPRVHVRIWISPNARVGTTTSFLASVTVERPLDWAISDDAPAPGLSAVARSQSIELASALASRGLAAHPL